MGCGSSQAIEPKPNSANKLSLIEGFDKKVEKYLIEIKNQSQAPTKDLKNFLAYFLNNELQFSYISNDKEMCTKYHTLIENGTNTLLECLPHYIKSNFIYAVSILKILSLFSLILFAFYSNKDKDRQLKKEEQKKLITKIENIEECLAREREQNTLTLIVTPTDSKEGEEILKQFGLGLLKSGLTFTLNYDLLESLQKGVIYIFQEYQLSKIKRKYKVMFYIDQVKISFLEQLEKSNNKTTFQQLMEPLNTLYLNVIKQSKDWEIWCFWIHSITDIISYKPKVKISELQTYQLSENEKQLICHEINEKEFVFEINWKIASNNEKIKSVLIKHPLYYFQLSLLIGYQYLDGFEQIYLQKIKQDKKNNSNLFDDTLIIKAINFLTHIRGAQIDFVRFSKKEQFTKEKLQEQVDMVSDLIIKISQLELQLKQFILWECAIPEDFNVDLLIEPQISDLIDQFVVNFQQYKNAFSSELLKNEIKNLDSSIEIFKSMFDNIRENYKITELNQDQLKLKITILVKFIQSSILFLKFNISILLKSQVNLKIQQNEQYSIMHQQNQVSPNLQILYDYQLTNDSLQILYQLVQQIKSSENQKNQQNRIKSKLEIVIFYKFSMFEFQYSQLIEIIQSNPENVILHKIVHESCVSVCQNIEKYLKQLMGGLKLIGELLEFELKMNNKRNNQGLNILVDEQELQELKEFLDNLFKKNIQEIEQTFNKFFDYVKKFEQAQDSYQSQEKKDLNKKLQKLKNIKEYLETLMCMEITKQRNENIINEIIKKIDSQIQEAQNIKFTIKKDTNMDTDFKSEINNFEALNTESGQILAKIQQTIRRLNKNLNFLTDVLTEEKEIFKIKLLKDKLSDQIINDYESDGYKNIINQLKQNSINKITVSFDPKKIKNQISYYPKELENDVCFLLDQIGSQEDSQEQQNIYDKYKEKITDIIDKNQWRIRQTIVYSLIQIQDRCLQEESYKIVSGLLVKLSVLETDKRIKQLFNDQQIVKDLAKLTVQYWPTQQESVQKIIKQKLKELDALSMEISSESQLEKKKFLNKQFNIQQDEINNQIKNIESLSSTLGITVLFLQDLKNNLMRIESKLQELQDSVNEIGQNIKYLIGRPFIDLFEIRMKRVLEQAQIINAEKVYVPIKTREKLFNEGIEDKETTLYTPQIIGEGEINEFLWQQEKNSLLIHGIAGSGKSTAARKIEEFLWDLYQKSKNTEQIPNLPIFVHLPQLKDPVYSAVEETLKSDNYRFNDRHIQELKEAVEQGKYRIIIIMDSYDELKQQYLESNLNISNKLSKWKSKNETKTYPKIITTSRTELFTVNNYHNWFMSESNDINFYKEIRLVKFNELQIQDYLNQYYELSKKKIIREHSENQDIIQFEKIWKQETQNIQNEKQIERIVKKESIYLVKQLLNELWNPKKYQDNIKDMKLEPLLETAFMLEIVVIVLPEIIGLKKNKELIKNLFVKRFSEIEVESLQFWNTLNDSKYDTFWSEYFKAFTVQEMEKVITDQFKQHDQFNQISNALIQQSLTSYDFYLYFFDHYFDREIQKLREIAENVNIKDLWQYTQKLAVKMTFNNVSSVFYEQTSKLFKKKQQDWKDKYFNNNGEEGLIRCQLRKCMPLNQKNNTYSFSHKSLQELLVAKWFIENIRTIENKKKFNNVNWQDEFLQGTVRFISEKLENDKNEQEFLFKIITKSYPENQSSIRSASNSIHLLNQMKYVFQDKNLSNIVLENVDLSGINFYKANLSNSNFKNVNISQCNFSDANLTAVKWEQTKLNEMERLKVGEIRFMQYFDENCLLVGHSKPESIKCYNPNEGFKEISEIQLTCFSDYENFIGLIKLNQKENNGLAIIYTDTTIYIVNYTTNQIIKEIICFDKIIKLVITDDEKTLFYLTYNYDFNQNIVQIDISSHLQNASQFQPENNNIEQKTSEGKKYELTQQDLEIIFESRYENTLKCSGNILLIGRSFIYQIKFKIFKKFEDYIESDVKNSIIAFANKKIDIHVYHESDFANFKLLKGHQRYIIQLSIIKNGERLLSYDGEGNVILWDLQQSSKISVLKINHIKKFATHYNSKFCTYRIGYLENWDIELTKSNLLTNDNVSCCALSFNDHYAVTASQYQSLIKIWDLQKGKQFGKSISISDVYCLQFQVDSLSFYSSTYYGYIYQWEVATQNQLLKINNFYDCITQIYPIDANQILTFQIDTLVKLWDIKNNTFKLIYHHKEDEDVQQFEYLKPNDYYEQSKKCDFPLNTWNFGDIVSIHRGKVLALLSPDTLNIKSDTDFNTEQIKNLYCAGQNKKVIVLNNNIFCAGGSKIMIYNIKELFVGSEIKIELKDKYLFCDMICYQEQFIYLQFSNDDNDNDNDNDNDKYKQIIEIRKLDDLEQIFLSINIPQEVRIICFDINEEILYFGGYNGTLTVFDISKNKFIQDPFKPHEKEITQIKYLEKHQAVLTVSKDAKIILSRFKEIIQTKTEEKGQPILFLSVSNDQDKLMIATQTCLSLYFIENQILILQERIDQFEDITSLFVDFENLDIFIGRNNKLIKAYLSLKRITRQLQSTFKYEPSQIYYYNKNVYIADDYGGINCLDMNGKKTLQIIEQTEKKNEIKYFKIYNNKMLTYDGRELKIYDLQNICEPPLSKIIDNAVSFHYYNSEFILIDDYYVTYIDNSYMRYSNNKIQGSDSKNQLLAIYGQNGLFKIYNMEKLTLQYNFSPQQALECDNANIKDAIIKNQQGFDIKPIFIQKNALEQDMNQQ